MKNVTVKEASLKTVEELSPPIAEIAVILSGVNPIWAGVVGAGIGLLKIYRELAEKRGIELLKFIEEHKEEFNEEITNSPDFRAIFIEVWEKHIRENSDNKRKRLRNFLLNYGSGIDLPPDIHTKIYSVIDQMTDNEAKFLGLIFRNSNREQFRDMHLNVLHDSTDWVAEFNEAEIEDICNSLHAYRLIDIQFASIGRGVLITQVTPFGEIIHDYILDSVQD